MTPLRSIPPLSRSLRSDHEPDPEAAAVAGNMVPRMIGSVERARLGRQIPSLLPPRKVLMLQQTLG